MKNRTNQILLATFLLTAALYIFLLLSWLEIIPRPFYDPDAPFRFLALRIYLGLGFHLIPCFCLQLLICRIMAQRIWQLLPVCLLVGTTFGFFIGFFASSGLDALGWGLLLCLCIAPAVGYALAWMVYILWQRRTKEPLNK